jgi:hypothetical protein
MRQSSSPGKTGLCIADWSEGALRRITIYDLRSLDFDAF